MRANSAKLDACTRHRFAGGKPKIGDKITCLACGGKLCPTDIVQYIRGYEAAGGKADDVWPGYRAETPANSPELVHPTEPRSTPPMQDECTCASCKNGTSAHGVTVPARPANCTYALRAKGVAYPRTCAVCGLGPCSYGKPHAATVSAVDAARLKLPPVHEPLPTVESPPLSPITFPAHGGPPLAGSSVFAEYSSRVEPRQRPRRIVGIVAKAGSGKSTAADHLMAAHGFRRGKFAGALKEMLRALLYYREVDPATVERMVEGDLKETPSDHLNGRTPRHAMQTLGTEWGRNCIHPNLWVDTEMDATAALPAVVFDDVRFENEANAISAAGGLLVSIERPGAGTAAAGHTSEDVGTIETKLVIRNTGTLDEFVRAVDTLA